MCYGLKYQIKDKKKYAQKVATKPEEVKEVVEQLELLPQSNQKHYYANGFDHPELLVFTAKAPLRPFYLSWD